MTVNFRCCICKPSSARPRVDLERNQHISSEPQPLVKFEEIGWQRISVEKEALDAVQHELRAYGVKVRDLDVSAYAQEFAEFVKQPCYAGEYRLYGGTADHCLLEKALEHFLSFKLINPHREMTGVDIGSCKSVAPLILRETLGCTCYEQDLEYPAGIEGTRIGSSADQIPLADQSVDFMTLHCTYEHFEGQADTGFVRECARLLKPNGKVVIAPLYLNPNYVNVTGEVDEQKRAGITFDGEASYHCVIPEWKNRFGRHYSPASLLARVVVPCRNHGLLPLCYRLRNWQAIHPDLWIRWIFVIRQPETASTLVGKYSDNWIGPVFTRTVEIPHSRMEIILALEHEPPPGSQYSKIEVELFIDGHKVAKKKRTERGPFDIRATVERHKTGATAVVELRTRPYFVPRLISGAPDDRKLCLVHRTTTVLPCRD